MSLPPDPFIESLDVIPSASITPGMDTSVFDQHRQGVELTVDRYRYLGMLKISAGTDDHQLLKNGFGQSKHYDLANAFQDQDYFEAYEYVEYGGPNTFPLIVSNVEVTFADIYDGVIEPLTIRAIIANTTIDTPYEAHAIRGTFDGGNGDFHIGNDVITDDYDFTPTKSASPFFDSADAMDNMGLPGLSADVTRFLEPFADTVVTRSYAFVPSEIKSYYSGSSVDYLDDSSFEGAYVLPSASRDYGRVAFKKLLSTAGFVYEKPSRTYITSSAGSVVKIKQQHPMFNGTDSLAFGGLLR